MHKVGAGLAAELLATFLSCFLFCSLAVWRRAEDVSFAAREEVGETLRRGMVRVAPSILTAAPTFILQTCRVVADALHKTTYRLIYRSFFRRLSAFRALDIKTSTA